jgi:uncharacterized protein YoxC
VNVIAVGAGDVAVLIFAAFFGVVAVVLALLLGNLFRVVTGLKEMVEGVKDETVPLIGEVGNTVKGVNKEIERLDGIAAGVQGIVESVETITKTVQVTVTNPLVKALAFLVGVRRAANKMRGDGEK